MYEDSQNNIEVITNENGLNDANVVDKKHSPKRKKIIIIVSVVLAVVILLLTIIIPFGNKIFASLAYKETIKNANVGDIIVFGKYEQDNDMSDGKEDIEWKVLKKEDDRIFVVSKYGLDSKQYTEGFDLTNFKDLTWETCVLREWLNDTFLNEAFNGKEKSMILTTHVVNNDNIKYNTDCGNDTEDKLFILSLDEANEFFSSDYSRRCAPTKYAIAQGSYTDYEEMVDGGPSGIWWLRTLGVGFSYATYVSHAGGLGAIGRDIYDGKVCVRPAMWIGF